MNKTTQIDIDKHIAFISNNVNVNEKQTLLKTTRAYKYPFKIHGRSRDFMRSCDKKANRKVHGGL